MPRNPITIEALETLDAIERRGSFAKAAEEMNKATSAVSYIVQKLEEQLGVTLFQRQGRRSVLTAAGQLVLIEGRDILLSTTRLANMAKEVSTGWEPRITIGLECMMPYPRFFEVLNTFLLAHPSIEVDVCECVLNGGWEALDTGRVDLIVGAPGPAPQQKGFRAEAIVANELVAVIGSKHNRASYVSNTQAYADLTDCRTVINHDTSISEVSRNAGLSNDTNHFYVQTIDQKMEVILAGIGVGHLPRHRIHERLEKGELIELTVNKYSDNENFIAWKISNKGKGLQNLSQCLIDEFT